MIEPGATTSTAPAWRRRAAATIAAAASCPSMTVQQGIGEGVAWDSRQPQQAAERVGHVASEHLAQSQQGDRHPRRVAGEQGGLLSGGELTAER